MEMFSGTYRVAGLNEVNLTVIISCPYLFPLEGLTTGGTQCSVWALSSRITPRSLGVPYGVQGIEPRSDT